MSELSTLIRKSAEICKSDGVSMTVRKAVRYIGSRTRGRRAGKYGQPGNTLADVLFINGCYLPHPPRYRITHQREQLWAADVSSNEVFYTDLSLDMVRLYRVFIFFRCPYTELVGAFIQKAKEQNKTVLYDIDDLMIDLSYTKTIAHLQTMSEKERSLYEQGVEGNKKTLQMCDGAITTTKRLAEELKKYVPYVYINRNVASEEMLCLSEKAFKNRKKEGTVRIGYFSGNITHNEDLEYILPVLIKTMEAHQDLELLLMGIVDCPKELARFSGRVMCEKFTDYRKLPEKLAEVDINLAPLLPTVFNEAKSENKWVEAALVKVPTIASKVGAFAQMIQDGINGVLCSDLEDWARGLDRLVSDGAWRGKIGSQAYAYCRKHCTSVYTAPALAAFIRSVMRPNIAFILPVLQISGGALVALKHCAMLKKAGYDVTLINQGDETEQYVEKDGAEICVVSYRDVSIAQYLDKAVATLWSTLHFFEEYARIGQKYYNVQNFETDFYKAGEGFKIEANRTYCTRMQVHYITISRWCQKWLRESYGKEASYAPNGIDAECFYPVRRNWADRKIRILVEGNSDDYYKNVDESFQIVRLLREAQNEAYEIWFMSYQGKPKDGYMPDRFLHKVPYEEVPDIYRSCDILLKSSLLESFSYPPLEMMATGGYVVAAPNDGNLEYLRDGENCLFYAHEDLQTAVQAIQRIVHEPQLRDTLYKNGVATAKERDWEHMREEILSLYDAKDQVSMEAYAGDPGNL